MTEQEIKVNYEQAMRQADRLDTIARNLEKLANDNISNTEGILKNAWQSDSSSQYYNKVDKVRDDICTTARKVREIAKAIRTTAKAVKNSEMQALQIARDRIYYGIAMQAVKNSDS